MNTSSSIPGLPRAVASPCIQVCAVDAASGLCLGCRRTLAEIAGWSRLTEAERAAHADFVVQLGEHALWKQGIN